MSVFGITLAFLTLFRLSSGERTGTLFVIVRSVSNPSGKLADGEYCDSPLPSDTQKCDMLLKLCYGTESSVDTIDSCAQTEEVDDLPEDTDTITGIDRRQIPGAVVRIPIEGLLPVPVKVKIRVEDRDGGGNAVIDNISLVLRVTNASQTVTFHGSRPDQPVSVEASVQYTCLSAHPNCAALLCTPSNSCENGFYNCDAQDQKVCKYGFSGTECTTLNSNTCPVYQGVGVSTWFTTRYTCAQTDYHVTLKFTTIDGLAVNGLGELKPSSSSSLTDVFTFSGQQDLVGNSLTLSGSQYTSGTTFTDLPSITGVISGNSLDAKITIGSTCSEGSVVFSINDETVPSCMYENPTCYRFGQAYNNYACCCRPGFSGSHCETHPDMCASHECKNLAECENIPPDFTDYKCKCKTGWYGPRCETPTAGVTCDNDPCQNGAVCVTVPSGFHCRCRQGFFGELCDGVVSGQTCTSDLCKNEGTCKPTTVESQPAFFCTCTNEFSGKTCEERVPQKPTSLTFDSSTSRTANLSWAVPDNYNGAIDIYQMLCVVTGSLSAQVLADAVDVVTSVIWTLTSLTLTELYPATKYECKVRAGVENKFSPYSDIVVFHTKAEAPQLDEVPVVDASQTTESSIFITMPQTNSEYGIITAYRLVVYLVTPNHRLVKRSAELTRFTRAVPTALTADMEAKLTTYDQAKALGLVYYISAEYPNWKNNFTIGDGMTYGGYVNEPLQAGVEYQIYYGVEVVYNGETAVRYVPVGPAIRTAGTAASDSVLVWIIIGVVAGVLLLLAILIAVLCYCIYRAKGSRSKSDKEHITQSTDMDETDCHVQHPHKPPKRNQVAPSNELDTKLVDANYTIVPEYETAVKREHNFEEDMETDVPQSKHDTESKQGKYTSPSASDTAQASKSNQALGDANHVAHSKLATKQENIRSNHVAANEQRREEYRMEQVEETDGHVQYPHPPKRNQMAASNELDANYTIVPEYETAVKREYNFEEDMESGVPQTKRDTESKQGNYTSPSASDTKQASKSNQASGDANHVAYSKRAAKQENIGTNHVAPNEQRTEEYRMEQVEDKKCRTCKAQSQKMPYRHKEEPLYDV